MAIKVSTGLRDSLLGTESLKTSLDGGFIKIYSGTAPVTADDAETGTLLVTVSVDDTGTGLTFDAPSGGTMQKAAAEVWSGTIAVTGTATHYRYIQSGDTGGSSTTEKRIQGTVGTSGADLNLSNTSLSAGALQTIDAYSITMPTP